MNKQVLVYGAVAAGCIGLDRITKAWVLDYLASCATRDLCSWLSLECVYNRGVAWSFFHGTDELQFLLVTGAIMLITVLIALHGYMLYKNHKSIMGHVLVVAGSVSNIADRLLYGGVVDWLCVHHGEWSWPVFNVADGAIVLGAVLMVVTAWREP
jgi:signal peptidase II